MKTKERKVKKRMPKRKKPVLTSPWKIGTFVSLLLVFLSLAVGCYIVIFYNVSLQWIKSGSGGWSIDSYLFFKEIYPLAAAVVLISLFAYFIIASAVRRYKFYLDSGQDYRTMISLAESIDDLTNPAQIARLSSYPELQAVLRNYGDQIREISQDIVQRENTESFDELESQIDELLGCADAAEEGLEGNEPPSICRKVRNAMESSRARIDELEKRIDSERRAYGQAALAYGRILEAISGAGEELLAITNFAGELASAAENLAKAAAAAPHTGDGSQEKKLKMIVSDMESSVRKLEDGGHVLHEFSEENNGIAINLALMASRGHVDEHDLATFAERVRSTAERFHKLSGTVSSIAQGLLGTCYALKEKIGGPAPALPGIDVDSFHSIVGIARRIEERGVDLQKQICNLGSELHDVHELLQKDFSGVASHEEPVASEPEKDALNPPGAPATHGAGAIDTGRAEEISELIIDHGKAWSGMSAGAAECEPHERAADELPLKHVDDAKSRPSRETAETLGGEPKSDFSDMSSLRELGSAEDAELEHEPRHGQAREDGSWMEMPGHRWLKINVEKAEREEETGKIEVTVKPPARNAVPDAPAAEREEAAPAFESTEEPPLKVETGEDEEPIYDLFELGAVEYNERIPIRK
jgi:methyl-accepting chemotaxis protein